MGSLGYHRACIPTQNLPWPTRLVGSLFSAIVGSLGFGSLGRLGFRVQALGLWRIRQQNY